MTGDSFVIDALKEKKDHIAAELLADDVIFGEMDGADLTKEIEAAGKTITIAVKK